MNSAKNPLNARVPLIALATLPLSLGLVLAQTTPTTGSAATAQAPQRVQPAQPGGRSAQPQSSQAQTSQTQPSQTRPQPSGTDYTGTFLKNLAAQLGTTPEKLKAAAVKAGGATIDAAVKAGDLPADRAAEMKAHLSDHPFAFGGRGGPGRAHGGPGGGRPGDGDRDGPRGNDPQGPTGTTSGT